MSASVDVHAFLEVLATYYEAFEERDPVRRLDLLARCMSPDAEIWGPDRLFAGGAAISGKIAAFHRNWPGCRLVLASGITTFDRYVRLGSAIVRDDGAVLARGRSMMEVAPDGRIHRVVPLWDATPPPMPAEWPARLAVPPEPGDPTS